MKRKLSHNQFSSYITKRRDAIKLGFLTLLPLTELSYKPLTPYGLGGAALGALAGLGAERMKKTDRRGFLRKVKYASAGALTGWLADLGLGELLETYVEPRITLGWKPIKVVNDKIYDIRVYGKVDNPRWLSKLEVKLIPVEYPYFITDYGMRREDYPLVFPPEPVRSVKLQPKGLEREMFSVDFTGLKGGREYVIAAEAKDVAGQSRVEKVKTPYIRQFENFGKQLYDRGIIVGASYMSSYQQFIFGKEMDDYPLLGKYVMPPIGRIDEMVLWKHVDWATGYGINIFFIDAGSWEKWKIDGDEGAIMKSLTDKDIKCAFMWGAWTLDNRYFVKHIEPNAPEWTIDLTYPKNKESFLSQLSTILNSDLVKHPNYFRINGKSVVFIYDASVFIKESDAWNDLINSVGDFYRIGDITHGVADPHEVDEWLYTPWKDLSKYNAISSWVGFIGNEWDDPSVVSNPNYWFFLMNKEWSNFAKEKGLKYVASISPGFKYYYEKNGLPRNVDQFKKRIEDSLKYTKFIRIDTWNDFGENTFIEPSQKDGFAYLQALKDMLIIN